MQASYFSELKHTLPAGEVRTFDITGRFLAVVEASSSFRLRLDHSAEEIPADIGLKYRVAEDELFTRLAVLNPHSTPLYFHLLFGVGDVEDSRLNVIPARPNQYVQFAPADTVLHTRSLTSITANTSEFLDNLVDRDAGRGDRVALLITNLDPTRDLYVRDANNPPRSCTVIFARDQLRIETSAACYLVNPNPVPVAVRIVEFYRRWINLS